MSSKKEVPIPNVSGQIRIFHLHCGNPSCDHRDEICRDGITFRFHIVDGSEIPATSWYGKISISYQYPHCFQKGLSISTASPRFRKTMTPQLPNVHFGPAIFFFCTWLPEAATPDPHRGQGSRHKLGGGFAKIKPRCRWPWNLWNCVISAFLRCFCGAQQLWHIKMYAYNYNIIWFNYFFRCVLIHIYIVYIVHTRSAGKFLKCTFEEYQKNIKTPPKITHG